MACRGCLECLLKILNFIFTLIGLAMVGYGIYLLVEYKKATGHTLAVTRAGDDHGSTFCPGPIVRAANRPVDYDSDDELIAPRQQANPATGVPVAGTLDQRPSINVAWSTRMREKYGLDTSEFTYNPNESQRYQQTASQPTEERSRLSVM